jgi:signal transduction histidine kinase
LYQVFDGNGIPIAQSQGLARHGVPPKPPEKLGYEIRYGSGCTEYFPLRLAWQKVTLNGQALILGVADPQRKYEGVLRGFTSILLLSTPFILLLATVCGLWLGRRALAPVARIADDARAIGESSLSARSAVPDSRDELQQLSETLNEMLDRIERSFTRTRQFTADASHELRAPMTLIDTAAQFSLRKERSREELVDSMRKILRESQRTTAVIDDLLTLARGDAGRETEGLVCFDAAPIVREVAQQASTIGTEKRVRVDLRLESETRPVAAHEPHLRRLLLILADNALKYTPAGGTVTMAGAMEDGAATITVADTGIGIAADDRPHVFERFWRADKVRSREAGGTGLGLAIARQIADRHHARLEARSEPGRGARSRSGCPPRSRQTAPEFITRPQLKLDLSRAVGARARVLEFGVGFEYWHNMFGKSADRVPGAKQFTPVFTVAAHLPLGAGVH